MTEAAGGRGPSWLGGRLSLRQPDRGAGHRAGTDALLLAAAAAPRRGAVVYDIGAATGAVGLAVAARHPDARVVLVEREPELAALARRNVADNGLETRTSVVEADVFASDLASRLRAHGAPPGGADVVLTNPPFLDERRHRVSPVAERARAHAFAEGGLARWIGICLALLKSGGDLVLIDRADGLGGCLGALASAGSVRLMPIHPRAGSSAVRVLVAVRKGGRGPLVIRPALVLHETGQAFTPLVAAIQRGEAALDL